MTVTYDLGKYSATPHAVEHNSLNFFIWGKSGAGKTTLAATLPGKKLWLLFDNNGLNCLETSDDLIRVDLSNGDDRVLIDLRNTDPMGIDKLLSANPDILNVVLDTMTTMNEIALTRAVSESKNSTLDLPGQHGYAKRNMIMLDIIKKLLAVCGKHKRNLCVLAHEGSPDKDDMTGRLFVTFIAGGELPNLIPLRFDEVWYLEDTGKEKRINIRNNQNRTPMKSRIFDCGTVDAFKWTYDPVTKKGDTIAGWMTQWKASNGKKIQPPK